MKRNFTNISVIGLGYIGLPTAAMFASNNIKVLGVDINQHVIDTINSGKIHIVEPGLDKIVNEAVNQGYLRAANKPEEADAFLIAVPTPFGCGHEPDLKFVEAAAKSIAPVLKRGDLVILESTSPVGTTEEMAEWLSQARPDLSFPQQEGNAADVNIAYCPERVLPGKIVQELVTNDRIIGGMTEDCSNSAIALYKTFVEAECIKTTSRTAEMCKLTENSFRDVNIAFANELSVICEKLDINVWELIKLSNRHPRVNILQPGPGVGGHCIAVDPWFIVAKTPDDAKLIKAARQINDSKPYWVLAKIEEAVRKLLEQNEGRSSSDVTICFYGLAFKPDIDDLRESPAMEVLNSLTKTHFGPIYAIEPNIKSLPLDISDKVNLIEIPSNANGLMINVILVAHREFFQISREFWDSVTTLDICGLISSK